MRPPPFEYLEPTTVEDACAELARHGERCAVLAGGQSLLAQLNARERRPAVVLSIARIPELARIDTDDGQLCIGAAVTQRAVQGIAAQDGAAIPVLAEALDHVGHVPTRNRGTVGGSIAFADPTAELPAVLLGLGGSVRLRSVDGTRTVPAADLFTGPYQTVRRSDELLTAVLLPLPRGADGERWVFEQRHFRRHAKVSVLAGARGEELTVAAAGLTGTPVAVPDAAAVLGKAGDVGEGIEAVAAAVADLVTPYRDRYGSVDYRRRLAVLATTAALRRVLPVPGEVAA